MQQRLLITGCLLACVFIITSCSGNKGHTTNPIGPDLFNIERHGMNFNTPIQLFDNDLVTADVDLASVVWGSASTVSGDLVHFQDDSQWAIAVSIQERDPEYEWEGPPEYYLPMELSIVKCEV